MRKTEFKVRSMIGIMALLIVIPISCNEATFDTDRSKGGPSGSGGNVDGDPNDPNDPNNPNGDNTKISVDGMNDGGAINIEMDDALKRVREEFPFGSQSKSPLVDYLLVVDNSVSMEDLVDKTSQGFQSLLGRDVFPKSAKIAVMNTMPSDYNNVNRVHPSVTKYTGINKEPGFLHLVTKSRIDAFKAAVDVPTAARFNMDGCTDAWFSPGDKNAAGQYCLVAHVQQAYSPLGTEAGIAAFHQFMLKNKDTTVFRQGAAVNVIFISDTHDPGTPVAGAAELINKRASFAALKQLIESRHNVSSIKFHGIVPQGAKCTSEDLYNGSYNVLINASKGVKANCNSSDYTQVVEDIVNDGAAVMNGVFKVSLPVNEVLSVEVDGQVITNYRLESDKRTIVIPDLDNTKASKIFIIYKF